MTQVSRIWREQQKSLLMSCRLRGNIDSIKALKISFFHQAATFFLKRGCRVNVGVTPGVCVINLNCPQGVASIIFRKYGENANLVLFVSYCFSLYRDSNPVLLFASLRSSFNRLSIRIEKKGLWKNSMRNVNFWATISSFPAMFT